MNDNAYLRGKRAVCSVLLREWTAHRSLWIGALLFIFLAALLYPFSVSAPYLTAFLQAAATGLLALSLFFLWTLNLLVKSFSDYTKTLEEKDKSDFVAGLYRGLLWPLILTAGLLSLSVFCLFIR